MAWMFYAIDATLISTQVTGQDARGFVAARFLDACFAKSADGLRSFLGGLYDVVQPEALMLLSARELELQRRHAHGAGERRKKS